MADERRRRLDADLRREARRVDPRRDQRLVTGPCVIGGTHPRARLAGGEAQDLGGNDVAGHALAQRLDDPAGADGAARGVPKQGGRRGLGDGQAVGERGGVQRLAGSAGLTQRTLPRGRQGIARDDQVLGAEQAAAEAAFPGAPARAGPHRHAHERGVTMRVTEDAR